MLGICGRGRITIPALIRAVKSRVVNGKRPSTAQTTVQSRSCCFFITCRDVRDKFISAELALPLIHPSYHHTRDVFSERDRNVALCLVGKFVTPAAHWDGHNDVICTNQQDAVITSSPDLPFPLCTGTVSEKNPSFCWSAERRRTTDRAVRVFSGKISSRSLCTLGNPSKTI